MKKIIFILSLITAVISPSLIFADSNSHPSLEDVLMDIMEFQSVSEKTQIECDRITDEQSEELGEAVMGVMHPDEEQHELMDQMMGGEGSESLKAMHIMMGENYLGCSDGMMAKSMMMGGGMMGGGMMKMMSSGGMMGRAGSSSFGFLGWTFMISFLILIILAIVALTKWLINQTGTKKEG